jgi:hypothetical protein
MSQSARKSGEGGDAQWLVYPLKAKNAAERLEKVVRLVGRASATVGEKALFSANCNGTEEA